LFNAPAPASLLKEPSIQATIQIIITNNNNQKLSVLLMLTHVHQPALSLQAIGEFAIEGISSKPSHPKTGTCLIQKIMGRRCDSSM